MLILVICCCCILGGGRYYYINYIAPNNEQSSGSNASTPTTPTSTTTTPKPITYNFKKLAPNVNSLPSGLSVGTSGLNYKFLGDTNSYEDCEKVALASSDISKIGAITWHNPNFGGGWAKKCYSINNTNKFGITNCV